MLKLDLKLIFWSLAVHRYPKQPPRVIIFAAMGPGMKLVIDKTFLAKKRKFEIFCKTYAIYINRRLRTCRIQIHKEKVWFVFKKEKKSIFFDFFPMSERSKKFFFSIFSKISTFFLKNGPRGPRKFEKKQSHEIWAYLERPQRRHANHLLVRAHCHPSVV